MNRKLALKLLVIGVVMGMILIALAMVNGTITDRQKYRDDAVKSIEASYAGPQTVIGPVLVRPYTQTTVTMEEGEKGVKKRVEHVSTLTATSFPYVLDIRGKLTPTERRHGLYTVTVYEFAGHLKGAVEIVQPQMTGTVEWVSHTWRCLLRTCAGLWGRRRSWSMGRQRRCFKGLSRQWVGSRIYGCLCAA